ncbi:hypothetical protein XENTR_v10012387 [Xenopus tropicalis]|nr:hypothetical protein XENTR_v10012387 [Xenopus tropicalis]
MLAHRLLSGPNRDIHVSLAECKENHTSLRQWPFHQVYMTANKMCRALFGPSRGFCLSISFFFFILRRMATVGILLGLVLQSQEKRIQHF